MEDNGATTPDRSGTGNTGTLTASPVTASGKIGSSVSLNGSSQYVLIGDAASLEPTAFTITAWIYLAGPGSPTTGAIYSNGDWSGANSAVLLRLLNASTNLQSAVNTSVNSYTATGPVLRYGQWQFVCMTYTAARELASWVDGVKGTPATASGTLVNPTYTKAIGADHRTGAGPTGFFNGRIDDFRIYNRALSAAEISALYNSRKHLYTGGN
jgi:hypothetical protein